MSGDTTITISVDHEVTLSVREVWPDGAPEAPTADDVVAAFGGWRVARLLNDWGLLDAAVVDVTVRRPNPHYGQAEALIPELAPEPVVVTTARYSR